MFSETGIRPVKSKVKYDGENSVRGIRVAAEIRAKWDTMQNFVTMLAINKV
jgi:hypothetical protein